jgi:hypothetical protein
MLENFDWDSVNVFWTQKGSEDRNVSETLLENNGDAWTLCHKAYTRCEDKAPYMLYLNTGLALHFTPDA